MIDKITPEQVELVKRKQLEMILDAPHLRKGQAFYNALAQLFPKVAKQVNNTIYDPFYHDCRIHDCIDIIKM